MDPRLGHGLGYGGWGDGEMQPWMGKLSRRGLDEDVTVIAARSTMRIAAVAANGLTQLNPMRPAGR
jgi:hypothetical protein